MTKLIGAIRFLTILPLPAKSVPAAEDDIGRCSACFPLVGLIQGVLLALLAAVFARIFSDDIAAALLVAALVLSNGGFHLDGLSDTFDALASRKNKEKMLAIMKDGTTGPIGAVSIVLIILLKYVLLKQVVSLPGLAAYAGLLLFPALARWSMVPALFHAKSARSDGLGKIFIEQTGAWELIAATGLAAGIYAAIFLWVSQVLMPLKMIALFLTMYICSFTMSRFFEKKFGGLTGDNLGAITETGEVLFLLIFSGFY